MTARIFKPSKSATQSGTAGTKLWVLTFDQETPKELDPLMGWTGSSDLQQQIRLTFASREAAESYAKRKNIDYVVEEPLTTKRKSVSYLDNFSYDRAVPWTH